MATDSPAPETPRASTAWLWLTVLPFGFGSWVPIVAGVRAQRRVWIVFGLVAVAATITALALPQKPEGGLTDAAGILATGSWIAGVGWTIACRHAYALRTGAQERVVARDIAIDLKDEERRRALRLAVDDPATALRRGVGRPDVPGSAHGWVVDVNHAPEGVLTSLPGIDADLARRIVATREEVGLFSSVDDLAFVLDLPTARAAALRGLAVAIPD